MSRLSVTHYLVQLPHFTEEQRGPEKWSDLPGETRPEGCQWELLPRPPDSLIRAFKARACPGAE